LWGFRESEITFGIAAELCFGGYHMRKLALAVAVLVATGTSALAGGSIKDVPAVAAPTWEGTYVGVQVGGVWSDWSYSNATADLYYGPFAYDGFPLGGLDGAGFTGGVHLGYNRQWGRVVGGIEADINWTNADDSREFRAGFLPFKLKSSIESYGTVRARLGVVHDRMLIYATGGFAWGSTEAEITSPGSGFSFSYPFVTSDNALHVGWTAGGGVQVMLGQQWFLGVEYKHIDLGNEKLTFDFPLASGTTSTDLVLDEVTLRLSRRF
jgi:outer membrane immunogenic protein